MSLNQIVSQNTSDKLDCTFRDVICRNLTCESLNAPTPLAGLPAIADSTYTLTVANMRDQKMNAVYLSSTEANNLTLPLANAELYTFIPSGKSYTISFYYTAPSAVQVQASYFNVRLNDNITNITTLYGTARKVDVVIANVGGAFVYLV